MAPIDALVAAYLVFAGLVLGSFINLAGDRLPRGESVVSPRSHCRACGRQLNFVDLLPVAGYVLRGGRCATCRTPIGASAPAVEAISGACMLLAITAFGLWHGAALGFGLVALLGCAVVGIGLRRQAAVDVPSESR